MPTSEAHAPALSTPQTGDTFTYSKVNKAELKREHLGLAPGDDFAEKLHDYYSIQELAAFLDRREPEAPGRRVYKKVTLQFPDSLICDSAAVVQSLQKVLSHPDRRSDGQVLEEPRHQNKSLENCKDRCICINDAEDNLIAQNAGKMNESIQCNSPQCNSPQGNSPQCSQPQCSQPQCNSPQGNQAKGTTDPFHGLSQEQRLWILADTSYSACCIDEVAAEHVGADLVVHFGDACLNPVASINAAYVFGKPRLDMQEAEAKFRSRYPDPGAQTVVLMADAPHTYLLEDMAKQLPEYSIIRAELRVPNNVTCIGYQPRAQGDAEALNRELIFPEGFAAEEGFDPSELDLFHVTLPEPPRLLQLTTKFRSVTTYSDGTVSQGPFPSLMRRYKFMHMARSAGTIGILVNTLSLANTKKLISEVSKKIQAAGKKHYVFVVGKPNVAKLANFEAVDVWCVLGCDHQGILLDQNGDYFKPIVTPYELLLAIGDEFSWTGQWITDFDSVLSVAGAHQEEGREPEEEDKNSSDEEPEFDPVTGKFVNARPLRRLNHLQISSEPEQDSVDSRAVVQKLSGTVALKNTVSTSAAHLQTREWTGLGSDWTTPEQLDHEGADVEEGDAGIARGYKFDTQNKGD